MGLFRSAVLPRKAKDLKPEPFQSRPVWRCAHNHTADLLNAIAPEVLDSVEVA